MLIAIVLLAQLAVFAALFVAGLKRLDAMSARIEELETVLRRRTDVRVKAKATPAYAEAMAGLAPERRGPRATPEQEYGEPPVPRALFPRRTAAPETARYHATPSSPRPRLSGETRRAQIASALLAAPALGLAFGLPVSAVMALASALIAAAFIAAQNVQWRPAAAAGAFAGAAWAASGVASGAAAAHAALFSGACLSLGLIGLAHARVSLRTHAGAGLAGAMAAALALLAAQTGMASAPGASFAILVLAGALIGASALRLEMLHVISFAAAGAGLFVLSGQPAGDAWLTPAAAWAGAAFLAIAAVRAPQLGARGALLASTGVIAPIVAVSIMAGARYGLDQTLAIAGAFAALALIFAGIIFSAARRAGRFERLRLTAWALGLGAAWCAARAGLALADLAPAGAFAAPLLLAMFGLGAAQLDSASPARLWRAIALGFFAGAALFAWQETRVIGLAAFAPPTLAALGLGVLAPSLMAAAAARTLKTRAALSAGALELTAIAGFAFSGALVLRFLVSGEALWFAPLTPAEAGADAAWLIALALIVALRAEGPSRSARLGAGLVLAALGLAMAAITLIGLAFSAWPAFDPAAPDILAHPSLAFTAAALAAFAHWLWWRRSAAPWRTHVSRGAMVLLAACAATLGVAELAEAPNWSVYAMAALGFASSLAGALLPLRTQANFAQDRQQA